MATVKDVPITLADILSKPPELDDEVAAKVCLIIQTDIDDTYLKQQVLEMLADAARSVVWRDIFGGKGLLAACSHGLHQQEPERVLKQRLRLIGNCCADNDSNRDIIIETDCYDKIFALINSTPNLQSIGMIVLFNFMNDHERSQKYACSRGLIKLLGSVFQQTNEPSDSAREYAGKCLELVFQLDEPFDKASEELVIPVLDLANQISTPLNTFQTLLGCLSSLLGGERSQSFLSDPALSPKLLELMLRLQYWDNTISARPNLLPEDCNLEDISSLIRTTRGLLVSIISDVSASELFQDRHPVGSELLNLMINWLSSKDLNILTCAALVIGNAARDSKSCEALVSEYNVHILLLNIIKEQTQIAALHSAGGALKNIVIGFPSVRETIVAEGVLDFCQKFYLASVMTEVQHLGLSLVRVLITLSFRNVETLVASLANSNVSALDQILELYAKNTEVPIRTEIGRIVVSVLREVARCPDNMPTKISIQKRIFGYCPEFLEPVIHMILQDKWPVMRSEGWFALALFSQTSDGANAIAGSVFPVQFYQALRQATASEYSLATDSDTVDTQTVEALALNTATLKQSQKDKENAYMFLSAFLKNQTSREEEPLQKILRRLFDGQEVTDSYLNDMVDLRPS